MMFPKIPRRMSRRNGVLAVVLALMLLALAWVAVFAAARTVERQVQISTPLAERERENDPASPAISFLDSPSPTCYLPKKGTNACYIEWNYLNVNAGSNYVISMTLSVDDRLRMNSQGFFQNSMYIPGDMFSRGLRVDCGVPGASGIPSMGQTHSYTLRARDSLGLTAANYGSLTCPADIVKIYLPFIRR
jgi:hypothetical protein